jgi:ABC-2 type transport system permease protein
MRIFDIALKDLVQVFRDKRSAMFLAAMPIVFTLFMGYAFGGAAAPDPRLAVGWVSQDDGGVVTEQLRQALRASDSLRLQELAPDARETAAAQVASGKLAAALLVPAGFSQQVLDGGQPQMILLADPLSGSGQSALQLLRVPVTRLLSAAQIAVLHARSLDGAKVDAAAETRAGFQEAAALWLQAAQNGPQIQVEKAQGQASSGLDLAGNPYNQSSPGTLVQFAIFGLINTANILVLERKTRTLARMQTTSLSRGGIIAGHLLAMFAITFLQQLLLVVFGQLVLKVNYFHEPLATLLMMTAVALMAAALGLLIGVIAHTEERVILYCMLAMFVFSALGGAWFPLEGSGAAFAAIGRLTPGAWAMTGFQNILLRGLDVRSVLLPAGLLLAYTAGFFSLAVWRFKE